MKKGQPREAELSGPSDVQRFLEHLWIPLPNGLIEIRALPNDRSSGRAPKQEWFEDVESALQFAGQFDDVSSGYGVYFGVGKRAREGGRKQDMLGVTTLWADIDTVNLGWDTDRCIKLLHELPDDETPGQSSRKHPNHVRTLRPSALVHSGGGLHAYWHLERPLMVPADTKLIERANAALARFLSGDNVGNVDRTFRLPGSWNAKRGVARARRCEVVYDYSFAHRHDAEYLLNAAENHEPLFVGPEFPRQDPSQAPRNALYGSTGLPPNVGIEELWAKRVRYHATGGKQVGVNVAIMHTTAKLHCAGWGDDRVVDEVLRRVKRIQATQAPHEQWDWDTERETIRKSLERWKVKWVEVRSSERKQ